jgi:hypothetical protein
MHLSAVVILSLVTVHFVLGTDKAFHISATTMSIQWSQLFFEGKDDKSFITDGDKITILLVAFLFFEVPQTNDGTHIVTQQNQCTSKTYHDGLGVCLAEYLYPDS